MSKCGSSIICDLLGKSESGVIILFETSRSFNKEKERQIERKYQAFKDVIYYGLDPDAVEEIDGSQILVLKGLDYFNGGARIKDMDHVDILVSHRKIPKGIIVPKHYESLDALESEIRKVIISGTSESKDIHRNLKRYVSKPLHKSAVRDGEARMEDFFPYAMEKISKEARAMFLLTCDIDWNSHTEDIKYLTESIGYDILGRSLCEPSGSGKVSAYQNLYLGNPYIRKSNHRMLTEAEEEEIDFALFFPCAPDEMPNPPCFDGFMQSLHSSRAVSVQTGSKIPVYGRR